MDFLDKTLNRLSFMDDKQLNQDLNKVLPKVLGHLNTKNDDERQKAIEILSHLSKRIRPNKSISLPCIDLLRVATRGNTTSFCRNFSCAFIEMGVQRMTSTQEKAVFASFTLGNMVDSKTSIKSKALYYLPVELMQCAVVLHLIENMKYAPNVSSVISQGLIPMRFPSNHIDISRIIDFLLDIMLTPVMRSEQIEQICNKIKNTTTSQLSSSSAGNINTHNDGNVGSSDTDNIAIFNIPPGLSPQRLQRLVAKKIGDDPLPFIESWTTAAGVEKRKLAVLNFLPPRGGGLLSIFIDENGGMGSGNRDVNGDDADDNENTDEDTNNLKFMTSNIPLEDIIPLLVIASVDNINAVSDNALSTLSMLRSTFSSQSVASHVPTFETTSSSTIVDQEKEEVGKYPVKIDEIRLVETIFKLILNISCSNLHVRSDLNWKVKVALLHYVMEDCPEGLVALAYRDEQRFESKHLKKSNMMSNMSEEIEIPESLCTLVVKHCLSGSHGSLKLRADGAGLAYFLANRVLRLKPAHLNSDDDDVYAGALSSVNADSISDVSNDINESLIQEDIVVPTSNLALTLFTTALQIVQSGSSYETNSNSTPAAIGGDGGAVRAGDLICGCCSVITVISRMKPNIATIGQELKPLITSQLMNSNSLQENTPSSNNISNRVTDICNLIKFEQAIKCGAGLFSLLVTRNTATHVRVSAAEALEALANAVLHTRMEANSMILNHFNKHGSILQEEDIEYKSLLPFSKLLWAFRKASDYRARLCCIEWSYALSSNSLNSSSESVNASSMRSVEASYLVSLLSCDDHIEVSNKAYQFLYGHHHHRQSVMFEDDENCDANTRKDVKNNNTLSLINPLKLLTFALKGDGVQSLYKLSSPNQSSCLFFVLHCLINISKHIIKLNDNLLLFPTSSSSQSIISPSEICKVQNIPIIPNDSNASITAYALQISKCCKIELNNMKNNSLSEKHNMMKEILSMELEYAFNLFLEFTTNVLDNMTSAHDNRENGNQSSSTSTNNGSPCEIIARCYLFSMRVLYINNNDNESVRILTSHSLNSKRFGSMIGLDFELTSVSNVKNIASSQTSRFVLIVCEIVGCMGQFMPFQHQCDWLIHLTSILNKNHQFSMNSKYNASAVQQGKGMKRIENVSCLYMLSSLLLNLHAENKELKRNISVVNNIEVDSNHNSKLIDLVDKSCVSICQFISSKETEEHCASIFALSKLSSYYVRLPNSIILNKQLIMEQVSEMDTTLTTPFPSVGEVSSTDIDADNCLNNNVSNAASNDDTTLPFNGDLESAISAGDRSAIRELMRRRDGVAQLPVDISTEDTSASINLKWKQFESGLSISTTCLSECATMVTSHSSDVLRASAASVLFASIATYQPMTSLNGIDVVKLAIDTLMVSASRNDYDLHFSIGFSLATAALRPDIINNNTNTNTKNEHEHGIIGNENVNSQLGQLGWGQSFTNILNHIIKNKYNLSNSPVVKRNASIWILCILVANCQLLQKMIKNMIDENKISSICQSNVHHPLVSFLNIIQSMYINLLLDSTSNELVREVASLGLSMLYNNALLLDQYNDVIMNKMELDSNNNNNGKTVSLSELMQQGIVDAFKKSKGVHPISSMSNGLDEAMIENIEDDLIDASSLSTILPILSQFRETNEPTNNTGNTDNDTDNTGNGSGNVDGLLNVEANDNETNDDIIARLQALNPREAENTNTETDNTTDGSTGDGNVLVHRRHISGSGGVYAELIDVAVSLGQAGLVHGFLAAVASHDTWTTCSDAKRCAQVCKHFKLYTKQGNGFSDDNTNGGNVVALSDIGQTVSWDSGVLPRVFRMRFDPNTQTSNVMNRLWNELFPNKQFELNNGQKSSSDGKEEGSSSVSRLEALFSYLLLICDTGEKWRDRESSLNALVYILNEQSTATWTNLSMWIEALWQSALGLMGDVKDTVVIAAHSLAKILLSLTKRFVGAQTQLLSSSPSSSSSSLSSLSLKAEKMFKMKCQHEAVKKLLPLLLASSTAASSVVLSNLENQSDNSSHTNSNNTNSSTNSGTRRVRSVVVINPLGRSIATAGLASVVAHAQSASLLPHVPQVINSICIAVSELEPGVLGYLNFHADSLNMNNLNNNLMGGGNNENTANGNDNGNGNSRDRVNSILNSSHTSSSNQSSGQKMDELRLNLARQGPLADALQACLSLLNDYNVSCNTIPPLLGLLRRGVGLATRATAASVVDAICEKCPSALRGIHGINGISFLDNMNNDENDMSNKPELNIEEKQVINEVSSLNVKETNGRKLLWLLCELSISESNHTVRKCFAKSLGNLSKVVPSKSTKAVIFKKLIPKWRNSGPGDHQERNRIVNAITQICKRASQQLDPSVWPPLLAMAFIARFEPNNDVSDNELSSKSLKSASSQWAEVWRMGMLACSTSGGVFDDMDVDVPLETNATNTTNNNSSSNNDSGGGVDSYSDLPTAALDVLSPWIVQEACDEALMDRSWHIKRAGAIACRVLAEKLGDKLDNKFMKLSKNSNWRKRQEMLEEKVIPSSEINDDDDIMNDVREDVVNNMLSFKDSISHVDDVNKEEDEMSSLSLIMVSSLAIAVTLGGLRVWEGKYDIFEALTKVIIHCPKTSIHSGKFHWLISPNDSLLSDIILNDDFKILKSNNDYLYEGRNDEETSLRMTNSHKYQKTSNDKYLNNFPPNQDNNSGDSEHLSQAGVCLLLLHQLRPQLPKLHRRICCDMLSQLLKYHNEENHDDVEYSEEYPLFISVFQPILSRYIGISLTQQKETLIHNSSIETNDLMIDHESYKETDIVIRCRSLVALAHTWPNCNNVLSNSSSSSSSEGQDSSNIKVYGNNFNDKIESQRCYTMLLLKQLYEILPLGVSVWPLRVAALQAIRIILDKVWISPPTQLQSSSSSSSSSTATVTTSVLSGSMIDMILKSVELNLEDTRYSQVKTACVEVLMSIVKRYDNNNILFLPYQDYIEKLTRKLTTSEEVSKYPQVASVGNTILRMLASWK